MDGLVSFFADSPMNRFMLESPWAFPAAETVHFMALTMLIGSLLVVDLRALGFFPTIPFVAAHKLIAISIAGFALNVLTGLMFLYASPDVYLANFGFRLKMLFIVLAGVNALAFEAFVFRRVRAGDASAEFSVIAKVSAALSLMFWFIVLILGRFLPFVDTSGGL